MSNTPSTTPTEATEPTVTIDTDEPACLTEFETSVVDQFANRFHSAPDSGPDRAEDLQEPAPSQESGSAPDPSAAPAPDSPDVEGRADDGATTDALAPSTPDAPDDAQEPVPPAGGEVSSDTALPESNFTLAGTTYTPAELTEAVQVRDWARALNDDQRLAIDALLSGQYQLVPRSQSTIAPPPQGQEAHPSSSPVAQATSPVSSTPPIPDDAGDWLDPRAEAEINALKSELSQLRGQFTPVAQQQQLAETARVNQILDPLYSQFATEYHLDQPNLEALLNSVAATGIVPTLVARNGGDVAKGVRAAMEMVFQTTPAFREPYEAARLEALQAAAREDTLKQQQLTALSTPGGSVPRREPVPVTKADRAAAMVGEIAAGMNGN